MIKKKLNILFIHNAFPAQFGVLAEYLQKNEIANTFFITNQKSADDNKGKRSFEILGFKSDELATKDRKNPNDPNAYYYSGIVEKAGRKAIRITTVVKEFLKNNKLDLIVAHGSEGSAHFLFDEVKIPIITYIEFPCYKTYGHDPEYPWHTSQVYRDKCFEMLSMFECLKSDLIITPTQYTKNMFPQIFHDKIEVQTEGFDFSKFKKISNTNKDNTFYIGYKARGISSAKGFEQFIKISQGVIKYYKNVKFVIFGNKNGPSYGYEQQFVKNFYGEKTDKTFQDYILEKYKVDMKYYDFPGYLEWDDFIDYMNKIDVFLYPLQYGSNNRGLFDILILGKKLIASNRTFIPEIITHNYDGILCDYHDTDQWVQYIFDIINNPDKYKHIEKNAKKTAEKYNISSLVDNYMNIFEKAIKLYQGKKN